jgi:hypothetical protein
MSHDPPKKHTSTWTVTLTCKMPTLDLTESKVYHCQPTASRESYNMVWIHNIRSFIQWWYSHFWHLPQSAEQWICPFPDETWHDNEFSLVSIGQYQTSCLHTHTLTVSSNSSADSVSRQCNMNIKLSMPLFLHSNTRTIRTVNSFDNKHFLVHHI